MSGMAADLTTEEMKRRWAPSSNKKANHSSHADADLAAVGVTSSPRATSTPASPHLHSPAMAQGYGTPQLPRLAGQQPLYLETIKQFNSRERNNDNAVMHSIASQAH